MIDNHEVAELGKPPERAIEFSADGAFLVDAKLIGELLRISASRVPSLMREGKITSICERGVDEHAGEFRLTFFYWNRRARLGIDSAGQVLRKSAVEFGDRPGRDELRRKSA
jgi:hypothetical protein